MRWPTATPSSNTLKPITQGRRLMSTIKLSRSCGGSSTSRERPPGPNRRDAGACDSSYALHRRLSRHRRQDSNSAHLARRSGLARRYRHRLALAPWRSANRRQHPVQRFLAATLDGFVNDPDAVFEAKFMLPWSFSEEAAAEKPHGPAPAQRVGHQRKTGGIVDHHRWRQVGGTDRPGWTPMPISWRRPFAIGWQSSKLRDKRPVERG